SSADAKSATRTSTDDPLEVVYVVHQDLRPHHPGHIGARAGVPLTVARLTKPTVVAEGKTMGTLLTCEHPTALADLALGAEKAIADASRSVRAARIVVRKLPTHGARVFPMGRVGFEPTTLGLKV